MSCLSAFLLVSSMALCADPQQAALEVTEKRLDSFKESRAELEQISKILGQLGDPRKKLAKETDDAYFERIRSIYVNRARGLILLHMEYEEVLRTRYELEADVRFYLWEVADESEGFAERRKQKVAEKDRAKREAIALEDKEVVIRAVLSELASRERANLEHKEKRTFRDEQLLAELVDDIKTCANASAEVGNVPESLELQKKYKQLSIPELREALRDVQIRAEEARFNFRYLEYEFSPEDSKDIEKLLGERYGKIYLDARSVVKETQKLEGTAVKVAILARETRDQLRELSMARRMTERRLKLLEFVAGEERRMDLLTTIAGFDIKAQADDSGNRRVLEEIWGTTVQQNASEKNSAEGPSKKAEPAKEPMTPK